jgi:hypothetical protein
LCRCGLRVEGRADDERLQAMRLSSERAKLDTDTVELLRMLRKGWYILVAAYGAVLILFMSLGLVVSFMGPPWALPRGFWDDIYMMVIIFIMPIFAMTVRSGRLIAKLGRRIEEKLENQELERRIREALRNGEVAVQSGPE